MLPRANRITRPEDFREVSRRARRASGQFLLVQVLVRDAERQSRAGFVVSRSIGGAVQRNLVRRRLRASFAKMLPYLDSGRDVVVRALPSAQRSSFLELHGEFAELMARASGSS